MSEIIVSYLFAFGVSISLWFIGNECARGKITIGQQGFLVHMFGMVFGNPRYDYMLKSLGSLTAILVIVCFALGLPRETMAMYWRAVVFHGFLFIVGPLAVIFTAIEHLKKRTRR